VQAKEGQRCRSKYSIQSSMYLWGVSFICSGCHESWTNASNFLLLKAGQENQAWYRQSLKRRVWHCCELTSQDGRRPYRCQTA
jgi:hypothetical protein